MTIMTNTKPEDTITSNMLDLRHTSVYYGPLSHVELGIAAKELAAGHFQGGTLAQRL